jgi:adenylosuccinate lyase
MRRYGLPQPYERLKELTRGRGMTREAIQTFIASLELPVDERDQLLGMSPSEYVGLASNLARSELLKD